MTRSWTVHMFLIRVKHLVHYYHIGTRSSHARNYRTGTVDRKGCYDTTHWFYQMVVLKDILGVGA